MAEYAWEAMAGDGTTRTGRMQAASGDSVIASLQGEGLFPLRAVEIAREAGTAAAGTAANDSGVVRPEGKSLSVSSKGGQAVTRLIRTMASLLAAGVPAGRAVTLAADMAEDGAAAAVAGRLRRALSDGHDMAAGMAREPAAFDAVAVAMARAGLAGGDLAGALARLAGLREAQARIAGEIRTAMTYPLVLLAVAAVSVAVLSGIVLPRFAAMFETLGVAVPPVTAGLLAASGVFTTILLPGLALGASGLYLLSRRPVDQQTRIRRAEQRLKWPVIGPVLHRMALARASGLVAGLVAAHVPLAQALVLAGPASGNAALEAAFARILRHLRDGADMRTALAAEPLILPVMREMAGIGQETGKMAEMLDQAAGLLSEDAAARVARAMRLMVPAITVALGVIVGAIVLTLMSAVMDIYDIAL